MSKTYRKKLPSLKLLNKYFFLDLEDYELYWKIDKSQRTKKGSLAGYKKNTGYLAVTIDNSEYLIHRIIWKLIYGTEPLCLDHIDRDKSNNKIDNLREVSFSENVFNVDDERYRGTSKYRGVFWNPINKNWRAARSINGKRTYLGSFKTELEAYSAYLKAKEVEYF